MIRPVMNGRPTSLRTRRERLRQEPQGRVSLQRVVRGSRLGLEPALSCLVECAVGLDRLEQPESDVFAHVRRQGHPHLVELRCTERHALSVRLAEDSGGSSASEPAAYKKSPRPPPAYARMSLVSGMQRVSDPSTELAWLAGLPSEQAVTGYDAVGWPTSIWVLHAMYENPDLRKFGTHDDHHRRRLESGDVAPLIIGEVDLDFHECHLDLPRFRRAPRTILGEGSPGRRIWHGSRTSQATVLSRRATAGFRPEVGPLRSSRLPRVHWTTRASMPSWSSSPLLAWRRGHSVLRLLRLAPRWGLRHRALVGRAAGPSSRPHLRQRGYLRVLPTNLWPADHNWFLWTDYDLQATKVSGDVSLIDALAGSAQLECSDWQSTRR